MQTEERTELWQKFSQLVAAAIEDEDLRNKFKSGDREEIEKEYRERGFTEDDIKNLRDDMNTLFPESGESPVPGVHVRAAPDSVTVQATFFWLI